MTSFLASKIGTLRWLMRTRSFGLAGLLIVLLACDVQASLPFFRRGPASLVPPSFPIPVEELASRQQEVAHVLRHPTLAARGPAENFECRPEQYYFFLDHPDRAVDVWRRIGAKCVSIADRGDGQFGWADDIGGDVSWEIVHRSKDMHVWYAHGKVRAGPVMPLVPVEVVVVLHHREVSGAAQKHTIEHHSEVFLHTDSKTTQVFARLMGTSTTRLAEQGLSQMQLFFSALCWYLDRHPERASALLREREAGR
jgi:hypothetical protein